MSLNRSHLFLRNCSTCFSFSLSENHDDDDDGDDGGDDGAPLKQFHFCVNATVVNNKTTVDRCVPRLLHVQRST